MAESVASFLINNLYQLLRGRAELILGVDDKVISLTTQFQMIVRILDQSGRSRPELRPVDVLVNSFGDLAYDAEDVIVTYIAYAEEYKKKGKLEKITHGTGYLIAKSRIGIKIGGIKLRIRKICVEAKALGIDLSQAAAPLHEVAEVVRKKNPFAEEAEVVGFDDVAEKLILRLTKGEKSRVVESIVGMNGLGKTTLANKVYSNSQVKKYFKGGRAWVYVSKEYSGKDILLGIMKSVGKSKYCQKEMGEDELRKLVCKCLAKKRYLVVLDDIWEETNVWNYLEASFPDKKNGSRVLITTLSKEVARLANPVSGSHLDDLRFLTPEESWELLRKKACLNERCSPELEQLGKKIVQKCGGLPLAIVVLGGVLSTKGGVIREWQKAADDVNSLFFSERKDKWSEIWTYGYNDLPSHLKCCFLYLAVYPEDFEIPAKQLTLLWVAEGLVKDADGVRQTVEETAECHLEMLIDRSLIQVIKRRSNRRVKTCRIHDCLREFCISEAKKENFLHFHHEKVDSAALLKMSPRRLVGKSSVLRYIYSNRSSLKPIRSVQCFTQDFEEADCLKYFFKGFKFIRVLNLDGVAIDALPDEIGKLYLLKYLGLGKASISDIPSSIFKLCGLQTLHVRSKSICSVPSGIWEMKQLRHLYFQDQACRLVPSNDDESSLENLQMLSTVCPSSCTNEIFGKLPNLLKLGVCGDLSSYVEVLSENLVKLERLESLKLKRSGTQRPLRFLPRQFPAYLIKVTLCDTELEEDPMEQLGMLKNLQILKLTKKSFEGTCLTCYSWAFPLLQVLQLSNFGEHEFTLEMKKGALPSLQRLVVHDCYGLHKLPEELWRLATLTIVDVWKPSEHLRRVLQKGEKQVKNPCKFYVNPPE